MSFGSMGFETENHLKKNRKKFYGKYRGIVTNNEDPQGRGRLKVRVPSVFGKHEGNWALPCFTGGIFSIPEEGTGVWVEFEEGQPEKPVWVGFWLAQDESLNDTNSIVKVGGDSEKAALGNALKYWLDNHTHSYNWTSESGSGTTDPPDSGSPAPSNKVYLE